jgi:hypothetical protein
VKVHDEGAKQVPTQEVIMTNIRLRIEDAIPTVGFGSVGTSLFAGAGPMSGRGSSTSTTTVAYRMAPVTAAMVETI